MTAQLLADEIMKRREYTLTREATVSRQPCPRASSINLECAREMFYQITAWEKKPLPNPYLMARFQEGVQQERNVIKILLDLGFDVAEGQRQFDIKDAEGKVLISGHIDGRIPYQGRKIPFEVKSLDPNVYAMINTAEDFNRYDWSKKYPLQIQTYLMFMNEPDGMFLLTDCKGHMKPIIVQSDPEMQKAIINQCSLVVSAVESKTPPEFCTNANKCRKCWAFGTVCVPPINCESMSIVDDPEMEAKLKLRESLIDQAKEYESLDKEIKGFFKGKTISVCGDFVITGKPQIRSIKAKEAYVQEIWLTSIDYVNVSKTVGVN